MSNSSDDTSGTTAPEDWHPMVRAVHAYWRSIHQPDGSPPRRSDFDPLDVPHLLPWIWMVDVHRHPLRFRFRLLGTRHVEAMGADHTGRWIDEVVPVFKESPSHDDYRATVETLKPSYRRETAHYHVADYREIERIMLPLVDDEGDAVIVLGLTIYHARDG